MSMLLARTDWGTVLACAEQGDRGGLRRFAAEHAGALADERVEPTAGAPYGRRPLHSSARGEVLLASWSSGAACAPHDHGEARGYVVVVEGSFVETALAWATGDLVEGGRRAASRGEVLDVERGAVHAMRAEERGMTLHVYVPRVEGMHVYDLARRETLVVTERCGAWVPPDASLVVRRWSWASTAGGGGR